MLQHEAQTPSRLPLELRTTSGSVAMEEALRKRMKSTATMNTKQFSLLQRVWKVGWTHVGGGIEQMGNRD